MDQFRPLFVNFRPLHVTNPIFDCKTKHRRHALDSNPGPQDGRLRRIHLAMAAARVIL